MPVPQKQSHTNTTGTPQLCTCRSVYPKLAKVGVQLVDALAALGGQEPVDMSLACMCETIDALGQTGFDKAYHNVEAFKKRQPARMLNVRLGLLLGL